MIIGAHAIIYSKDSEADRRFFRDILKLSHVDVGEGWLIFGLPPAELAVHPSEENDRHEFYFMVEDIKEFLQHMKQYEIICSPVQAQGWGSIVHVTLPGGGRMGVYEPRHARPKPMRSTRTRSKHTNGAKMKSKRNPKRNP